MSLLETIHTGKVDRPNRLLIYGTPGVGKTTWAAGAPRPICIQTEDGADQVGLDRFPKVDSYDQALDCLKSLAHEAHDYKTLVVDSTDWMERLIHAKVAKEHNATSIDDDSCKAFSFQKGYGLCLEYWKQLIEAFDYLRDHLDMATILIAHSEVKRFDDPRSEGYDRYQPRVHKFVNALLIEWCDAIFFAGYEAHTRTEDKGFNKERTFAIGDGRRVLYTDERPSHVAKSRWKLPATLPLDYQAFADAKAKALEAAG